jgi:hypothetical protein
MMISLCVMAVAVESPHVRVHLRFFRGALEKSSLSVAVGRRGVRGAGGVSPAGSDIVLRRTRAERRRDRERSGPCADAGLSRFPSPSRAATRSRRRQTRAEMQVEIFGTLRQRGLIRVTVAFRSGGTGVRAFPSTAGPSR